MPTYSYKCKECSKVFDAFHSMSCTDAQHCPACDGVGQKLMSASSVIFKGSGFYSTDYRDSGYLEAKKKDADKPGESKTEAKATGENKATPAAEAKPEKIEKPAAAKAEPVAAAA
ncbi:MAG: FmdB family zinc ribbon protein [Candidatus Riflebacteria bacterium]